MKKAAIITLTGNFNYGNKLQNYAIQEIVKRNGYDVYTLWNKSCSYNCLRPIKEFVKLCILPFKDIKKTKRTWNFYKFNKKYIKTYHKTIYTGTNLSFLNEKFDKFIIGSDQIWNAKFGGANFGNFQFAMFADKNKAIAYSASIGTSSIPEEKKEIYIKGFEHLSAISVREEKAKEIVKELSDIDARLVLDPTMLLDKTDWEKIIKNPKVKEDEGYILTYFLGGLSENKQNFLREYAERNHLKIINMFDKDNDIYFYYDPSEFLYLIKNSKLVLTDSFHACIFSIIFNKSFYVFDREDVGGSMSSRLDTLLNRYKLVERKLEKVSMLPNLDETEIKDYAKVIEKIELDKKESLEYIQEALLK